MNTGPYPRLMVSAPAVGINHLGSLLIKSLVQFIFPLQCPKLSNPCLSHQYIYSVAVLLSLLTGSGEMTRIQVDSDPH
jgi:hypothetical protein